VPWLRDQGKAIVDAKELFRRKPLTSSTADGYRKGSAVIRKLFNRATVRILAGLNVIAILAASTTCSAFGQSGGAPSVFKTNCISCHAADGRGSAVGKSLHAVDFHSPQVQQQSDAQLADVIDKGRGNMPAFGSRLDKDQAAELVKYVRSLGKRK
jgi:mono/diheme cytochrome c family protein